MIKKLPRDKSEKVQSILANKELSLKEKAHLIYSYNYSMLCRETDGRLPNMPSEMEIYNLLVESEPLEPKQ